jgi:hypothetical protein
MGQELGENITFCQGNLENAAVFKQEFDKYNKIKFFAKYAKFTLYQNLVEWIE